ncbi:MAG: rhomboid family intramembrane serine protease [Desulfurococcales archaeon]|nr:rhomboid family intramembrane serine protease [Desulfurococcales archaeon]
MSEEYVPRPRRPVVTYFLIALNVAVYVMSSYRGFFISTGDWWVKEFALVPALLIDPAQLYRLLTSMFLHANFLHILFNMYFLYFFGKDVEEAVGGLRYIILYFISGLAATAFHVAYTPIMGFDNLTVPALGASGAISGVLGAYLLLYPKRRLTMCWFMWLLPFCFTMSAETYLIFWFALQLIYGFGSLGTVAFFAHAGGFVTGLALLKVLGRRAPYQPPQPYTFPFRPYGYFPYYLTHPRAFIREFTLDRWAKVILIALLAVLLVGAGYSTAYAYSNSGGMYLYTIAASYSNSYPQPDVGAYIPGKGLIITPASEAARVTLNRLYWAGLLRGESGETLHGVTVSKVVTAPIGGVPVQVTFKGDLTYDGRGVLISASGKLITDVLVENPYTGEVGVIKGRTIYLRMGLVEGSLNMMGSLILPSAVAALVMTSLAMIAVIMTPATYIPPRPAFRRYGGWM